MNERPTILSASDLMLTFLSNVNGQDVRYISGNNPFAIKIDGEDAFIYIKNLSPAHLSNNNPDVWRIQLPTKDEFDKIKESSAMFFLLGYDARNKVYTTWNPYWCKQRLNVGKSVSMYSRYSLQKRVSESGQIENIELNNDGNVVCIPAQFIYSYIKSVKEYYPEETIFVARGSSIQKRIKYESGIELELFQSNTSASTLEYATDEFGKLKELNDSVIAKLKPYYVGAEYPDYEAMIDIASEYYPIDVTDKMTPVDWIKLFSSTQWKRIKSGPSDRKLRIRRPNLNLKVTDENGVVIQNATPLETFVYMIENSYPDLLLEIDFGCPVISKDRISDFPGSRRSQQQIKGGYFLSTNFGTRVKARILQKISDELGLNWKIEVIE